MAQQIALVTGGTGFVGSNLCRRLVYDGWHVHLIAIPNDNYDLLDDIKDQIDIHIHDGSTDGMNVIIAESQPDMVFHLASLFLSEHTSADISRLITGNVLFGTQLLDAMATHGVTRIINTGTSWQHYENKPYSPVNLYAATKQAFEDILHYYAEAKNIQTITLQLYDTYGANDPRPKLLHLLAKVSRDGSELNMSPGDQLLDLVYIDDVVQAFCVAACRLISDECNRHEIYSVSSGRPMPLKEMVTLFIEATGKNIPIKWGGRPYREREVMFTWDKGESLPGWKPHFSFTEGMKQVLSR